MAEEKATRLQSLNQSETEVLHELFKNPNFRVIKLAKKLYRGEGGIRTNLTAIFDKLGVPEGVNKREYVFREYAEAYGNVFQGVEGEVTQESQRVEGKPESEVEVQTDSIPAEQGDMVLITKTELEELKKRVPDHIVALVVIFFIFIGIGIGYMIGATYEHFHYGFMGDYIPLFIK